MVVLAPGQQLARERFQRKGKVVTLHKFMNTVKSEARRERRNNVNNNRYKGVRRRKWIKWVAEIRRPNTRDRVWLGSYDATVFCLRGGAAILNFPMSPPDIPVASKLSQTKI
ncbi:unnamed protein product [Ilex paraguariensis]|uniref:AP2/ERF domain-containing protein n=1 Tax=Ilex paraguariensis TaxID=185542 RepID=A0ABC8SVN6_9AQUA